MGNNTIFTSGIFGGGSATPSGPAGGTLAGTYPNPTLAGLSVQGAVPFQSSTTGVTTSDGTNFIWDATNLRLGLRTNAPLATLEAYSANTGTAAFTSTAAVAASAGAGITASTQGAPSAGDQRLGFYLLGSRGGGTSFFNTAGIQGFSGGAWSVGSSHPSYMTMETTPSGSTTRAERARITAAGNLLVGGNNATDRNYKFQVNNSGSVGVASFVDNTATTGVTLVSVGYDGSNTSATTTQLRVRAGAGQGGTALQVWATNGGSTLATVDNNGNFTGVGFITATQLLFNSTAVKVANNIPFLFSSTNSTGGSEDLGIYRNAAGVAEINNGTPGTFRDLYLRYLRSSANSTGAGSALLGTNCPAVTPTAPFTWIQMIAADGSTIYVPAWK